MRDYWGLPTTFNPVSLNPRLWAKAAKAAGMKYVVFLQTVKHHDGFCMFDTRLTDYGITLSDVPFHSNTRSNVVREVFNAFRQEGFGIGHISPRPTGIVPTTGIRGPRRAPAILITTRRRNRTSGRSLFNSRMGRLRN